MIPFLKPRKKALPDELVAAIDSADIVFRNKDAEEGPRPLVWGFLEGRPVYADEPDSLRKRLARHFDLTEAQTRRALALVNARVSLRSREDNIASAKKPRRTWVNSWSSTPWEL